MDGVLCNEIIGAYGSILVIAGGTHTSSRHSLLTNWVNHSLYLQMKMNMDLKKLYNQSINNNWNNIKNILRVFNGIPACFLLTGNLYKISTFKLEEGTDLPNQENKKIANFLIALFNNTPLFLFSLAQGLALPNPIYMVYRGLTPLLQILRFQAFKKQNAANAVYANMILMRGALLNEMADTQIWIRRNSHAHIVPEKDSNPPSKKFQETGTYL
ncbi:hypothetical protein ACJX0J_002225 (mitochondrion) [Zea mays]